MASRVGGILCPLVLTLVCIFATCNWSYF